MLELDYAYELFVAMLADRASSLNWAFQLDKKLYAALRF